MAMLKWIKKGEERGGCVPAADALFSDGVTGRLAGASVSVEGELVFNTAMTGYVETLTDPSYAGQILVFTYPLQGNYGVPAREHWESGKIQVQGIVLNQLAACASHHLSQRSLDQWCKDEGVPILTGIDTRRLTCFLRERGTLKAQLLTSEHASEVRAIDMKTVLAKVVGREVEHWPVKTTPPRARLLVVDTGVKENILRSLQARGAELVRVPWNLDWEKWIFSADPSDRVDGVLLANGPGDPADAGALVDRLRRVLSGQLSPDFPVFGICLGHQLLALAAGATTRKMRYGHRAINQPVRDILHPQRLCYLTSQNHGYEVQVDTLARDYEPWMINLNDGTNEGLRHRTRWIRSVQFHPEASPGPRDTAFLFHELIEAAHAYRVARGSKRGPT